MQSLLKCRDVKFKVAMIYVIERMKKRKKLLKWITNTQNPKGGKLLIQTLELKLS